MRPVPTLFINLYTEMGGGEYGLLHLLENIDRGKIAPVLLVNGPGPLAERVGRLGIEVVVLPFEVVTLRAMFLGRGFGANLRASFALRRLIAERGITAVSCSDVLTLFLLLPSLLATPLRVLYSVIFFYEPARRVLFNALALLFVDHIIVLSDVMRSELSARTIGLSGKIAVSYWGVDTTRFRPRSGEERRTIRAAAGLPTDRLLVGLVGRYEVWKGHLTFLAAAERLCAWRDDVHVLIVGGALTGALIPEVAAYHARVRERVAAFSPRASLHVLEHRDDIAEIIGALDVLVCPSDREPYGLVVLESLASGVPVVASSTVGALEVVEGNESVFVCEPGSIDALCEAMKRAVSSSIGGDDRAKVLKTTTEWPRWRDYSVLLEAKITE